MMSMTVAVDAVKFPKKAKLELNGGEGMNLSVKRLTKFATVPTLGSNQAAGYDLYSAYDVYIRGGEKALAKTDIAVALPEGCYGRVGKEKWII